MKSLLAAMVLFMGETLEMLSQNVQNKLHALVEAHSESRSKEVAEALTSQERATIIAYLKSEVQRDGREAQYVDIDVLIDLGDDETIAKEAQEFPRSVKGGASNLEYSTQPKVVAALAPKVFVDEPYRAIGAADSPGWPTSFEAMETIRRVLVQSPYFSHEVNQWAASWKFGGDPIKCRDVMRDWWNVNKAYFYVGNYAAVRPGAPPPPGKAAVEPSAQPTATPESAPTVSPREATTLQALPSPPTVAVRSNVPRWIGIGVGGVLLTAALYFAFQKRAF